MTGKEILSSFSQTLLQDERILSSRERELLTNLLQHAREKSESDSSGVVADVIAQAIGETVAQRAFTVLGAEIVEHILESQRSGMEPTLPTWFSFSGPRPPKSNTVTSVGDQSRIASGPRPPTPSPGPGSMTATRIASGPRPPTPSPGPGVSTVTRIASGPRPPTPSPGPGMANVACATNAAGLPESGAASADVKTEASTSVALLEQPELLTAQFVILDEFLVPDELAELTRYALSREADFVLSEVIAPDEAGSTVDYEHRRSRVLMDIGEQQSVIVNRIQACLPSVLQKLGREMFKTSRVEVQMTASNDGDFFRYHNDNGQGEIASRELTFVYFFHREPKAFCGGELRIYDSRLENGEWVSNGNYQSIVPRQNQIVFFPSLLLHEITRVECPSKAFADSRFTVNGWFHR